MNEQKKSLWLSFLSRCGSWASTRARTSSGRRNIHLVIHGPGYELRAALRPLDAQLNVTVRAPLSAIIAIFRNAGSIPCGAASTERRFGYKGRTQASSPKFFQIHPVHYELRPANMFQSNPALLPSGTFLPALRLGGRGDVLSAHGRQTKVQPQAFRENVEIENRLGYRADIHYLACR